MAALLAACASTPTAIPSPAPPPAVTFFPQSTPAPTPTSTPLPPTPIPPPPTPLPPGVFIDPALPGPIGDALRARFDPRLGAMIVTTATNAALRVTHSLTATPVITVVYALAGAFPTLADDAKGADLIRAWAGDPKALTSVTNDGNPPILFMAHETRAALGMILGPPAAQARLVITDAARLATAVWAARPAGLAILPFDQLDQRWKLLHLDGVNLFERTANLASYPLILRVGALGDAALARAFGPPQTNRDPARMAVVAMTGVTALVRGTAIRMDEKGQTWPGAKIREWLRGADIAHISNEVSFMDKCPAPDWNEGTVFCSSPKRLELLKDVGTDVIELTGNHLWDRGWVHLSTTLGLYRDLGWATFGGGRTFSESLIPLTMTVNGNRIAFVGCNYFGANWATATVPGSARCGRDSPYQFDLITPTIKDLAAQGYLVIATVQYAELYDYKPTAGQVLDFEQLRAAGAVVVNGSQGHHVQGFSVTPRGFIHYGTGNLFFGDQEGAGTHQTFVDRHVFYNGRYLGADLRAAYIENESQPVPMTPVAKAALLKTLFTVSTFEP